MTNHSSEILELKNTMNEMRKKNATESIKSKIEQTEERICEVEDRSFESIQSEENKEKKWKRLNKVYVNYEILQKENQPVHY